MDYHFECLPSASHRTEWFAFIISNPLDNAARQAHQSGSQQNLKSSDKERCSNLRLSTAFGNSEKLQMATEDLALQEVKRPSFVMQEGNSQGNKTLNSLSIPASNFQTSTLHWMNTIGTRGQRIPLVEPMWVPNTEEARKGWKVDLGGEQKLSSTIHYLFVPSSPTLNWIQLKRWQIRMGWCHCSHLKHEEPSVLFIKEIRVKKEGR